MDIFAHGLWSGAVYKAVNKKLERKNKKPLSMKWAIFWGIFPDLFAFAIPFVWIASGIIFGNLHLSDIPRPHQVEPPTTNTFWVLRLAQQLYNVSHSGIVFLAAFLLAWLFVRRPVREMGGWLLHTLIDIPTHSYQFYPAPVFWPISGWKFIYGIAWSQWWFMILNYSALAVVYFLLWRKKKRP